MTQRGWGLLEDALARENDTVHASLRAKGRPNIAYSSIIQTAFALVIIAGLVFMLRMDLDPISYIVIAEREYRGDVYFKLLLNEQELHLKTFGDSSLSSSLGRILRL